MGLRQERIKSVVRAIVGGAGISGVSSDSQDVRMPYPYHVTVTTSAKHDVWLRMMRNGNLPRRVNMHFRVSRDYNGGVTRVVAMPLDDFIPLLQAHYEKIQREGRSNAPEHLR